MATGVINPHKASHRSRVLQGTFFKQIRQGALRASQFPETMTDEHGTLTKPRDW